jgi:hypothetical protein
LEGGVAEGFHFSDAFLQEAGVGFGEVVDVGGVDHDFAGAGGEVGEEGLPDLDGGFAGGGEAEEPVGGFEVGGEGFSCEFVGEADLEAVGEGKGDGGEADFTGAAEGGDFGLFANFDERIVEIGDVGGVFVGVNVGGGKVAGLGVADLGDHFIGGLLLGLFVAEAEEEFGEGAKEFAGGVLEFFAGGEGFSLDEVEVDADAECGGLAGEIDGAVAVGHVGHQGGGGEDAFLVGAEDAVGNGGGEAEVICIDDEGGHGGGVYAEARGGDMWGKGRANGGRL